MHRQGYLFARRIFAYVYTYLIVRCAHKCYANRQLDDSRRQGNKKEEEKLLGYAAAPNINHVHHIHHALLPPPHHLRTTLLTRPLRSFIHPSLSLPPHRWYRFRKSQSRHRTPPTFFLLRFLSPNPHQRQGMYMFGRRSDRNAAAHDVRHALRDRLTHLLDRWLDQHGGMG